MSFRFQSQATIDLLMLDADAKTVFGLLGKSITPQGVLIPEQLSQAIASLQLAAEEDHAMHLKAEEEEQAQRTGMGGPEPDVFLWQRLMPLIQTLQLARDANKAVVWSDNCSRWLGFRRNSIGFPRPIDDIAFHGGEVDITVSSKTVRNDCS